MSRDDDVLPLYPVFNGVQQENLDDFTFHVEALVAGTKPDEQKLPGPRLVRPLGGIPGASRREHKIVTEGYKTDALDKMLLANRRYEIRVTKSRTNVARSSCNCKMAFAEAVKHGVTIDDDRRVSITC